MKKENNILVSILITSYNRLVDLKETIKRCHDITYKNLEIIIVDAGSNDGSAEYVKQLDNNYIKKIIEVNQGPCHSHGEGMKIAKGKYIITIDDDCFINPNIVEETVKIFEKFPLLSAIGYGFINPNINFNEKIYNSKIDINIDDLEISLNKSQIIATSGAAFRNDSLKKIGYYDLDFYWADDKVLSMDLIASGFVTAKISSLIAFHKSSPSNRYFNERMYKTLIDQIKLTVKFYPLKLLIKTFYKIIFKSIYFSIINKNFLYILALFYSLNTIKNTFRKRNIIDEDILKKFAKPEDTIFSQ